MCLTYLQNILYTCMHLLKEMQIFDNGRRGYWLVHLNDNPLEKEAHWRLMTLWTLSDVNKCRLFRQKMIEMQRHIHIQLCILRIIWSLMAHFQLYYLIVVASHCRVVHSTFHHRRSANMEVWISDSMHFSGCIMYECSFPRLFLWAWYSKSNYRSQALLNSTSCGAVKCTCVQPHRCIG